MDKTANSFDGTLAAFEGFVNRANAAIAKGDTLKDFCKVEGITGQTFNSRIICAMRKGIDVRACVFPEGKRGRPAFEGARLVKHTNKEGVVSFSLEVSAKDIAVCGWTESESLTVVCEKGICRVSSALPKGKAVKAS